MTFLRIAIPLNLLLSMTFSENRRPFFRIMLQREKRCNAVSSGVSGDAPAISTS
jgi:hypothetical protein